MADAQSFLAEVKRRNVFRATAIYAAAVWALAQGIAQLGPSIGLPDWVTRWFLVAAIIGFPFWTVLAWFYEFTPHGLKRESGIDDRDPSFRRATGRKLDYTIIGILAVAVVLLVTNQFVLRGDATSRAQANVLAGIPTMSVAVLPLANASPDKDQVYFSDGLSEDLINTLSQFDGLKVISAHSSFQFRNTSASAQEIGTKLGVTHLVEGSVRHAGDMVRITAQLVNAADGSTLWSEHYDRPYKNVFALQDAITQAIGKALQAKLLPSTQIGNGNRPPGGNVDAYAAFLRGKAIGNKATREANPEPGYLRALAEFDTAIQLDPNYAAAMANESTVWANLSTARTGTAKQRASAKARELATKAQALDPNNVTVLNALANLHSMLDRDWAQAVAEYRRAIQIDPHSANSKANLAQTLVALGQSRQAVVLLRESLQIDPLSAFAYNALSGALIGTGKLDQAAAAARKMAEVQPSAAASTHGQLAVIEILRGNAANALAEARQSSVAYGIRDANVALALQIGSDRAAADAALKALIARPASDQMYGPIAEAYALRKDPDRMFTWLTRAVANGEDLADGGTLTLALLTDPFLKPYQHDPRFAALCKQLGLPAPGEPVLDASTSVTPASRKGVRDNSWLAARG